MERDNRELSGKSSFLAFRFFPPLIDTRLSIRHPQAIGEPNATIDRVYSQAAHIEILFGSLTACGNGSISYVHCR